MELVLKNLQRRFPKLVYKEGDVFCWSPETKEIFYSASASDQPSVWSLLHETSHALLGHTAYRTDFQLLQLELAAWEKAKELSHNLSIEIDEDHVQDCLDTYRDWLHARSICPYCSIRSLQQADLSHYQCFNCHAVWKVSPSRFCRAYRATKHNQKPSAALFHASEGFSLDI